MKLVDIWGRTWPPESECFLRRGCFERRRRPGCSGPGQVFQQDAAHLPQGGRALLRAVKAREDGLRRRPVQAALQSGTTRSVGAWPANRKAIVWYGTPGATGSRPMASSNGLSTRRLPIALIDLPWKFSSLITARPFSALSSSTRALCSANGRTRPPKRTPTMLFASRLPRWGWR